MITAEDLRSGISVKAQRARGYRDFILWQTDGGLWFKFVIGHGQIAGYYIHRYLNTGVKILAPAFEA